MEAPRELLTEEFIIAEAESTNNFLLVYCIIKSFSRNHNFIVFCKATFKGLCKVGLRAAFPLSYKACPPTKWNSQEANMLKQTRLTSGGQILTQCNGGSTLSNRGDLGCRGASHLHPDTWSPKRDPTSSSVYAKILGPCTKNPPWKKSCLSCGSGSLT